MFATSSLSQPAYWRLTALARCRLLCKYYRPLRLLALTALGEEIGSSLSFTHQAKKPATSIEGEMHAPAYIRSGHWLIENRRRLRRLEDSTSTTTNTLSSVFDYARSTLRERSLLSLRRRDSTIRRWSHHFQLIQQQPFFFQEKEEQEHRLFCSNLPLCLCRLLPG